MTSKIGLLWDSVSNNTGDQAIGIVLDRILNHYQQIGLRSIQHLGYVLSQKVQIARILEENEKLRQQKPPERSVAYPDVGQPVLARMPTSKINQSVQIIVPVPGNYFYRLTGQRVCEALQGLGMKVVMRGLHDMDDGDFDRCIIVHPSEAVHEFVNYQKTGDYNDAYRLLGHIRKHSRQFDMLLMECVQYRWFKDSLQIFQNMNMDCIIDLGFHSQIMNLEPDIRPCYRFIFNGLTASESEKLEAVKSLHNDRPIPWIFVGLSSPKRLQLVQMLSRGFDESGLVYMIELAEPVRAHGPHISHENFRRIQQLADFTIWCSHHDYFYLESERFREALLAGTLPIKVLYEPIPAQVEIPFGYLLVQQDTAVADLRRIKDQYNETWQRFYFEFMPLPRLDEEFRRLFQA
jgi:hypothetical protein